MPESVKYTLKELRARRNITQKQAAEIPWGVHNDL